MTDDLKHRPTEERIPDWVYEQSKGRKGTVIISKLAENIRKWRLANQAKALDPMVAGDQEDGCRSTE